MKTLNMKITKTWSRELKNEWIATMKEHREADRLIRGAWLIEGKDKNSLQKGCFFGCAMQADEDPLEQAAEAMSLPFWLVELAEAIYEGMPEEKHLDFPVRLFEVIPIETDISMVKHEIAVIRLTKLLPIVGHNPLMIEIIEMHKNPKSYTEDKWKNARESAWKSASACARESAREWAWEWAWESAWLSAWLSARESAWKSARACAWKRARAWACAKASESAWNDEAEALIKALKEIN